MFRHGKRLSGKIGVTGFLRIGADIQRLADFGRNCMKIGEISGAGQLAELKISSKIEVADIFKIVAADKNTCDIQSRKRYGDGQHDNNALFPVAAHILQRHSRAGNGEILFIFPAGLRIFRQTQRLHRRYPRCDAARLQNRQIDRKQRKRSRKKENQRMGGGYRFCFFVQRGGQNGD